MDDAALAEAIRGAQGGDAAAFERLVDAYTHRIAGFFHRLTGSRHDAEDLAQEVFVRVVRMIGSYEHTGRFEAWIFRIAANLARDRVRLAKRNASPASLGCDGGTEDGGAWSGEVIDPSSEPADERLIRGEARDALNAALARLPDAEREVVLLRHFSQMSFKEIAELMQTPLGTALARAHRGLARLRRMMTEEADGCRVRGGRAEAPTRG